MTTGYSGTPLAKKLSLKDGMRVWRFAMPETVAREIAAVEPGLQLIDRPAPGIDAAHLFVQERGDLERQLNLLYPLLDPAGFIWVSWPKKASKLESEISEDVIRKIALPMGLVDVKVCAVDDVWSGLKLMIRREHRPQ